ncbi:MAG TPA: hypothetical protein VMI10_01925 [Terriglobales bacterium]|nr:hypothetical protein [Terriglobales bacterium]
MTGKTSIFGLVLVLGLSAAAFAQEDESPQSLGDVARNLRREKAQQAASAPAPPPTVTVVDNDNLKQVMEDASRIKPVPADKTVISLSPSGNMMTVSSPDVTCSMSFNSRGSSLVVRPALVENLPLEELVKLDGPAAIHDDNLQVDVFNGTEWALREITVALTLERRPGEDAEVAARARVVPAADGDAAPAVERHSDVTLLFHLKTETKPFERAALREYVGLTPGADEDWRWSIVEAKGIRPAGAQVAPESLTEPLFGGKTPAVPATNAPRESWGSPEPSGSSPKRR